MNTLAYVFGAPGSGKTTLMREVCSRGSPLYTADTPIKHRGFYGRTTGMFSVLGGDGQPFGGTDTLSYTAAADCDRWLEALSLCNAGGLVFGEGDRLADGRFFDAARRWYTLRLFYLDCPEPLSEARRRQRAKQHGLAAQSETWVRGRITKHNNLACEHPEVTLLDARDSVEELAARVWRDVEQGA